MNLWLIGAENQNMAVSIVLRSKYKLTFLKLDSISGEMLTIQNDLQFYSFVVGSFERQKYNLKFHEKSLSYLSEEIIFFFLSFFWMNRVM